MRQFQIGIVGSMADLKYDQSLEELARTLGEAIAASGVTLIFGAEKDADSLPTTAARAARAKGGLTVGVTYEKGLEVFDSASCDVVVATGLVRGGGRELVQALSCDGIIAVSGGSGTLNEMTVAYQANIPVVVLGDSGGWSQKLSGQYLDGRRRYKFTYAKNAREAVDLLLNLLQSRQRKF